VELTGLRSSEAFISAAIAEKLMRTFEQQLAEMP
jgi:hypothetical protein